MTDLQERPMVLPSGEVALLETAYRWMATSRAIEERVVSMFKQGRLRGRVVLGHGQEAIPVGAALCLEDDDVVAPLHRDLGVHLVRGTTPFTIFLSYLGRATSPSAGRDGDVHMGEWSRGVFPMVSHLPDSWPIAGGIALAHKLRGEPRVTMAFCGDGATSTGTWHETVNFVAVTQVPMVLIVENNQFAYSTPTASQYRCERIVDRAAGYGIPGEEVDGNDVVAVHEVVQRAVHTARAGGGPTLLVAHTMRMAGHAFHDAAAYVPDGLREEWAAKDPLDRCAARLRLAGWDDDRFTALHDDLHAEMRDAWERAEAEPMPGPDDVATRVYADV
jgi:TPP-dependent pyruvate/acetoin dehydrogenase alpha subunit